MNDFRARTPSWSGEPALSENSDREAPWRNIGTSMSAISFGFVATAILISMFLIMAIFEHLIRNRSSFLLSRHHASPESALQSAQARALGKLGNSQTAINQCPLDVSVLMPGQRYPTYIAQPAPLPCQRERIIWPSHYQNQHSPQE